MSSSDLNLPDLAQGGAVAQPRNNAPADTSEDMRERIAADLRPVFDVPVSVQAVIGRTAPARSSNSTAASVKLSTFMSTSAWSRAVRWSSSKTASA